MRTWRVIVILSVLVCMIVVLSGCTAPQPSPTVTPAPVYTAVMTSKTPMTVTETTRPMVCHKESGAEICLFTDLTETTTEPTTIPTPEAMRSPMAAPVKLSGVGNDLVKFETQAPGVVTFKMRNGYGSQTVKNCEEKYFRVALAGASIDTVLYDKGMALSTVTRTFNLINPGTYTLSVKSCGQWEIKIS